MKKELIQKAKLLSLGVIVALFANMLSAWSGPQGYPVANNVAAPINAGPYAQAKGKTTPLNANTTLDINGKTAVTGLGVNGNATIGRDLVLSSIANNSTGQREICVDQYGKFITC